MNPLEPIRQLIGLRSLCVCVCSSSFRPTCMVSYEFFMQFVSFNFSVLWLIICWNERIGQNTHNLGTYRVDKNIVHTCHFYREKKMCAEPGFFFLLPRRLLSLDLTLSLSIVSFVCSFIWIVFISKVQGNMDSFLFSSLALTHSLFLAHLPFWTMNHIYIYSYEYYVNVEIQTRK